MIGRLWRQKIAPALATRFGPALKEALQNETDRKIQALSESFDAKLQHYARLGDKPWKRNFFVPDYRLYMSDESKPFMNYSTCSAADFFHPKFSEICGLFNMPVDLHRKLWEWVFIFYHAVDREAVGAGKRALGFGVGSNEPLPAIFAKRGTDILATDAPPEIGVAGGWTKLGEYAPSVESLLHQGIIEKELLLDRVKFDVCDMNDIGPQFREFDFCWSSCCLEHLGNLQNGLDFIINSVERTLKVGGIACHTTEFNLSSDNETIESGPTVLYRKKDIDGLVSELRRRGHAVQDVCIAPDAHHVDTYVDTPPYAGPHLKLEIGRYAATSIGLVVQRMH